tara:strand:+ start:246 stop:752 length:507 start_codon:yes stop_codon:yes gene_type:complete
MDTKKIDMNKLKKGDDIVYTFPNYLSKDECNHYASTIKDLGKGRFGWPERTQNITHDPIVERLRKFLNKTFNLNLNITAAQTQNWHETSSSSLHIHTGAHGYRPEATYTSSIYLNDDFGGGIFFTKNGIRIKPEIGLLTFFDGRTVWHGLEEVTDTDRKTLIFFWGGE